MTISTSTVERLIDTMLDIKKELKADINRVEGKVDEALVDLRALREDMKILRGKLNA